MKYIVYIKFDDMEGWHTIAECDLVSDVRDLIARLCTCSKIVSIQVDIERE